MITQWHNCYDEGWKGLIVPEAFSHPAKMSRGLLKRILAHAKEQGWLKEGDVIVDPFGGIGSTGILGAYEGYQVVCCELEQKFVDLAEQNFELHKDAWVEFGNPYPIILQGDSRQLCQIVEKADAIISSPPFVDSEHNYKHGLKVLGDNFKGRKAWETKGGTVQKADCIVSSPPFTQQFPAHDKQENYKGFKHVGSVKNQATGYRYSENTPGQLGAMKPGKVDMVVSSPPYSDDISRDRVNENFAKSKKDYIRGGKSQYEIYGTTKGNLGNLKSGDVDAIISSPPYSEAHSAKGSPGGICDKNRKDLRKAVWTKGTQGENPDNLGNLKSGDVDCVISSPPYEGSIQTDGDGIDWSKIKEGGTNKTLARTAVGTGYGKTKGQLAEEQGDTFWQAAKLIVEQCFQILKPGGHAIWVVKSFVRKGKIVDFPGDWQRLCESVGFKTVCVHHAMLVKETKHQTLFGDTEIKRKERKSFFRRLAESKGSPRIDFEVVLCMEKSKLALFK